MSARPAAGGERAPFRLVVILAVLGMFGPFSIDTAFPAFARMGEDLSSSPAAMQQVVSVYMLAFASMSLFHGPISDAVGRKPVMITGSVGYVLASAVCALAPTLPLLLTGRALQGFTAGAATIVSRAVVRDLYDGPAAQRLMSAIAMVFAIGPGVAPVFGGWLLLTGTWRSIFWALSLYGLLVAVVVALALPESLPADERRPFRPGPLVTDVVTILRDPAFLRVSAASAFSFGALFLWISSTPILLPKLGLGEQDFGLLFVPMVGAMATGSFLANRLAMTTSVARRVGIGQAVAMTALVVGLVLVLVPATSGELPWFIIAPVGLGFGTGLYFPLYQLAMIDLFPRSRGAAASGGTFLTLLANSAVAGGLASLVGDSLLTISVTTLGMLTAGVACWVWHVRDTRRQS